MVFGFRIPQYRLRPSARSDLSTGAYTGTLTRKAALQAKEANQSSDPSKATPFLVAMKSKKGHKHTRSDSRGHSTDRRKRHSGPRGSEDTVPSSEETVTPEQPKLSLSATLCYLTGPKASGAGSTYIKRMVGTNTVPLGGRRPGDGQVPNSALSIETLDGQLV